MLFEHWENPQSLPQTRMKLEIVERAAQAIT